MAIGRVGIRYRTEGHLRTKRDFRRDNGDDWKAYLRTLAMEEGMEDPTDEDLRKFDQKREGKKVSNDEWFNPNDPDAKIAKMKDGRTHLAYKVEHAVDRRLPAALRAGGVEMNSYSRCEWMAARLARPQRACRANQGRLQCNSSKADRLRCCHRRRG